MAKDEVNIKYIWQDRKRILGMPISFTKYGLNEDRLFIETGLLTSVTNEVLLYRIKDMTTKISLWQKIFGVGTIIVHSADNTESHFEIKNIKRPKYVKELLHKNIEENRKDKHIRLEESMDSMDDSCEC